MSTVAVAIVCKTPAPGKSKTRLSPPLLVDECARLSACFIRDLAATVAQMAKDGGVTGYALYTPLGSEALLEPLLPRGFRILPQVEGDFGERLAHGARTLLKDHEGAILVNSDSPTLPASILREAVSAVSRGARVVLGPALDGGYTLIGVADDHPRLFEDIRWSTPEVYPTTLARAGEIGLEVVNVGGWYDVDDATSLKILEDELAGERLPFTERQGANAPATREFLKARSRVGVRA